MHAVAQFATVHNTTMSGMTDGGDCLKHQNLTRRYESYLTLDHIALIILIQKITFHRSQGHNLPGGSIPIRLRQYIYIYVIDGGRGAGFEVLKREGRPDLQ